MITTINSLKSYKTPLRYPGGKSRACKKMEPFIPDLRDYEVYYEPFLGGGSVALHITKKYLVYIGEPQAEIIEQYNTMFGKISQPTKKLIL